MAVDANGLPAERADAPGVSIEIVTVHGLAPLAEPVDVKHTDEVVELVVRGDLDGLPLRAFGHLAIAQEDVGTIRQLIEEFRIERHAQANGKPLAERTGGRFDKPKCGRGMPFKHTAELALGLYLFFGYFPRRKPQRVEQWRRVAFGKNQPVVIWMLVVV